MKNAPVNSPQNGAAGAGGHPVRKTSFFTVFVNESVFGLEVKEAQAIFRVGTITPIPLINKEVAGFINLRGKVVVAVSLRRRLGASVAGDFREGIAIGVEKGNEHFALLVDRVGDVLALPDSAKAEFPPHCNSLQSRYTRALYAFESRLFPILDVDRLFDFKAYDVRSV